MIWHKDYPIQSEHIRCHGFAPDDDIPQLIAQYHRDHARAVILVNDADNYTLASPSLHGDAIAHEGRYISHYLLSSMFLSFCFLDLSLLQTQHGSLSYYTLGSES